MPDGARLDRPQPALERRRPHASSRAYASPEERLAEVRPTRCPKPPTNPFTPAMPTLDPADRQNRVRARRASTTPASAERAAQIVRAVRVPVVVPEHRDDGHGKVAAGVGDDSHLVDLAVLRSGRRRAGSGRPAPRRAGTPRARGRASARAGVDVAGGRDADRLTHAITVPEDWNNAFLGTEPFHDRHEPSPTSSTRRSARPRVLRDNDIPFALAGGLAVYARGGPPTEHDVDWSCARRTPTARSSC